MFQLDLGTGLQATKNKNKLLKKKILVCEHKRLSVPTIATHYLCTTKTFLGGGGREKKCALASIPIPAKITGIK